MESSQNSDNSSQLPRGLISRRGTQTQRLPSLRSDSHSSQSLISANVSTNPMAITTKGGVLKRTFKPTIPVRRHNNEENAKQNDFNDNSSRRGKQQKTSSQNSRSKANPNAKNWVQTEGAVFRGDHNSELRSSRVKEESTTRKRGFDANETQTQRDLKSERFDQKSPQIKIESKAKIIRKLYGDNFIDDEDQSDDRNVLFPKGWQSVSAHRSAAHSSAEPLNPYNLLQTESQEKLLIMQLPEEFVRREDGYVGKLRVYKSGRIELCDTESDIKFDILFDRNTDSALNVKQENDNKVSQQMTGNSCEEEITEDVVFLSDNDLCALATIEQKQVLLAVPQIPLDERIGPHLIS